MSVFPSCKRIRCYHCGKVLAFEHSSGPLYVVSDKLPMDEANGSISIKCQNNKCGKINYIKTIKNIENDKMRDYNPAKEIVNGL